MVTEFSLIQFLSMMLGVLSIALLLLLVLRHREHRILQDHNRFLETLIESIPSPVFYKNPQGVYIGCNKAFMFMLGRTRKEIVGKTVYDVSPVDLAKVYEKADNDLFESGGDQLYETQVKYADGSIHEMFFSKTVFTDARGKNSGILGIMIDITDRKRAEEALLEAHESLERKVEARTADLQIANTQLEREVADKLRAEKENREKSEFLNTVINSIDHGLVVVDAHDYSIKLANKAASGGISMENKYCHELFHDKDAPCGSDVTLCPLHEVKTTGKPAVTQHNHLDAHGEIKYVEIHSYPIFGENGEVIQIIDTIIDMTIRKKAERALVDAKEMAEATNRMMSEFIDTVSHELRTPMTSVQGFAKLIEKTFVNRFEPLAQSDIELSKAAERIEKNLSIIQLESRRLTDLIGDHLDLSKLESGRMDWRQLDIEPASLIERTRLATASLFVDKDVEFVTETDEGLPSITGDPDRLLQVLINLVSNAEKFTQSGSIHCKATLTNEGILFSVTDTGIGIAEEDQGQIFSKFKQVQTTEDGKPSGTGLGLAISEKIVKHHGGRIWVESELGKGSIFQFTLPV